MIRTRSAERCFLCGSQGDPLYHKLKDCLFGVSGEWDVRKCRADACGLLWIDPLPVEEDILLAYRNYYTHDFAPPNKRLSLKRRLSALLDTGYLSLKYGYGDHISLWTKLAGAYRLLQPLRKAGLDFGVSYLRAQKGGRLLEVGCGAGDTLKILQDFGWSAEGVDFDPQVVAAAREKGLQVRQGTLTEQNYPDEHFDAIAMSHLLEHVHDPLALLGKCRRLLKRGGCLVAVTPNVASLGHRFYGSAWRSLDLPRHLHLFTLRAAVTLVERAGFAKHRFFTTVRDANNVFLGSRDIARTGRYIWGSPHPTLTKRVAKIMAGVEWVCLSLSPSAGEELVLILEK